MGTSGIAIPTAVFNTDPPDPDFKVEEIGFFAFAGDPRQPTGWRETRAREYVIRARGGSRHYFPVPSKTAQRALARLQALRQRISAGFVGSSLVNATLDTVVSRYKARLASPTEAGLIGAMLAAPRPRPGRRRHP